MRKPTIIATLALTTALALTGCTNTSTPLPEDTTSGSPTPSYTTTPQTEDEAIAGAKAAINDYWAVLSTQATTNPADTSPIKAVASGQAAIDGAKGITLWKDEGLSGTGQFTFDASGSGNYASDLTSDGQTVHFGFARINGCVNPRAVHAKRSDGTEVTWNGFDKGWAIDVQWSTAANRWLVTDQNQTEEKCS